MLQLSIKCQFHRAWFLSPLLSLIFLPQDSSYKKVTSTTKSLCGTVPPELNHLSSSRTKNYDNSLHVITLLSEHPKKKEKRKKRKQNQNPLPFFYSHPPLPHPLPPPLSLDQTDSYVIMFWIVLLNICIPIFLCRFSLIYLYFFEC